MLVLAQNSVVRTPLPHRVDFAKKTKQQKTITNRLKNRLTKAINFEKITQKKQKQTQPKTRKTGRLKKESKTDSKILKKRSKKNRKKNAPAAKCSKMQQNWSKKKELEKIWGKINNFAAFCSISLQFAAGVLFCDFFLILF